MNNEMIQPEMKDKKPNDFLQNMFWSILMGAGLFYLDDKYGYERTLEITKYIFTSIIILLVIIGHVRFFLHWGKIYPVKGSENMILVILTCFPTAIVISLVYLIVKSYLAWWKHSVDNQL